MLIQKSLRGQIVQLIQEWVYPEKLLLLRRKFPYQLIQKELPSEGLIVNPITNSRWTTSSNWSHWFKHHMKWTTASIWSSKSNVTSRWTTSPNWSHWFKYHMKWTTASIRSSQFNFTSRWTTSSNWSHWFKRHMKWTTASIWRSEFNVTSKRNMTWTTSSFVITAKTKVTQEASLRITRKTSSSIRSHRYSLYDKCHIKTEYDMNYKSIYNHCKNESHSRYEFKNHKEIFIIKSEPKVFAVWQMSNQNGIWH